MKDHVGKKIREAVKKSGMSVTEFARKINYSRRNIYSIFEKESIDTSLLKKIGDILERDFFVDYSLNANRHSHIQSQVAEPQAGYGETKIQELMKEVEYLKEINSLLKAQLEKLSKGKKKK
ncbi:MAG: XRE family transcriptional regulator [Bacteroidetes bacterium]|nr:MAG: XRE family transcriptional regulator [Bacteroidota bacterium]